MMKRRAFIKTAAASAAVAATQIYAPYIMAKPRPKLRVLGTHVTLQEKIRQQAEHDLGIDIEFYPGGSADVLYQAATRPESFDIYEQWSNSLKVLWQANTIQPIDKRKIQYWSEINDLTKKGSVVPGARKGVGDAPYKLLYAQPDRTLSANETDFISFLPYVHNADAFGYNSAVIPKGIPYETESWGWLLDEKYRGKVALVNAPTIGLFDAALAVEAQGLMRFKNMGNMSRAEVDQLFEILMHYKNAGQFRGVWSSVPRSVALMENHEVVIESMFSPAVSVLNGRGVPCIYAAPKEGYRAWHGVMCLSAQAQGEAKETAYKFMNWWLSGWAGAFIARQGYYIPNAQRSKPFMSQPEWDYWYDGKPASTVLMGTDGKVSVQAGEIRTGGSYVKRFSNIAVWNTVMDSYEYSLSRWNEFLIS
ncbi:MAG: extracellular solute-binding protein [Mariprofundales bacterium]